MQDKINIGEIEVPVIIEDGVTYYPISFVMERVLLKKTNSSSLLKEYSIYINKHMIDYGVGTGGPRLSYFISEEGLRKVLSNSKIGRLNIEQKRAMNTLLEYLHMDVISEDNRFIKRVTEGYVDKYNTYIKDCIEYVLGLEPDIVWQKCTKCGNYYPYHLNFFRENPHSGNEYPLYTVCKDCTCTATRGIDNIQHPKAEFRLVYNKYGEDIYLLYKSHEIIGIYEHWLSIGNKMMPKTINNEEDKLIIIRHCFDKGMFSEFQDITSNVIHKVCRFRVSGNNFIRKIQEELFGVSFKNGVEFVTDIDHAKKIFKDYIKSTGIKIDDPYNYIYEQIIREAHLYGFLKRYNNNVLGLVMELYDNKYPAYKFKTPGLKYWEVQENRIKALKYLIEEDMKIPIEKVPLYITLTALRNNGTSTMYNVCKKYYKNLFEWINEVYPDQFNEMDFDIHYIRNDFDSIEEAELNDILQIELDNVLYNPRNTERTISIDGMVPDWLAFTPRKCYIVEYFGMAVGRDNTDNKRINDYQEKTIMKIEKYEEMECYGKVYLYPDDLKDNFKGVYEKLKLIQ